MGLAKIKQWLSVKRILTLVLLSALVGIRLSGVTFAATLSQSFTQSYAADEVLQRGIIVVLDSNDGQKVHPAKIEEIEKVHGVVVENNDAPVTLSVEGQQVFVATTGRYEVLVSTQNGSVNVGDYITLSNLEGIGMRADDTYNEVVFGKALNAFDGKSNVIGTTKVGNKEVALGRVMIDISISRNPLLKNSDQNINGILKRVSDTVAGKPVAPIRVYVSLLILVLTLVISGSLLYSGVKSSIISVGRNPLSKKTILHSLLQVFLISIIVLLAGIFGIYLLLRF